MWHRKPVAMLHALVLGVTLVPSTSDAIPSREEMNQGDWSITIHDRGSKQNCARADFTIEIERSAMDQIWSLGPNPRRAATLIIKLVYRSDDGRIRRAEVGNWFYSTRGRLGRDTRWWTIPDDAAFDPDLECKIRMRLYPEDEEYDRDPSNNVDLVRGRSRGKGA